MTSFAVVFINSSSVFLIAVVIGLIWLNRTKTGAPQLLTATIFMMIWAVSSFVEILVSDMNQKILWRNITQIGVFYTPPACLMFSVAYSGLLVKYKKSLSIISYTVQTIGVLLIFTDSWHHLLRESLELVQLDLYEIVVVNTTVLGKVFISISFIDMLLSLLILSILALRTTSKMKKQVVIIVAGMSISVVYSLIKVFMNERFGMMVPISGFFAVSCLVMLYGIVRYDFLMLLPIARNKVFNIVDEGIVVASPDGTVIDINEAGLCIFCNHDEKLMAENKNDYRIVDDLIHKHYPKWHEALMECKPKKFDIARKSSGQVNFYHCDTYILDNKKSVVGTISVIRDITEQKLQSDLLKIRAEQDGLTGIYNRQTFIEHVERELMNADTGVCLMVFDLDDFKQINDNHGHVFGDYVLKEVCSCISSNISPEDIFGRIGGEEFAILLKGLDLKQCVDTAEKIRLGIEQNAFMNRDHSARVTISIGLAMGGNLTFTQLFHQADSMLYAAKESGKNRTRY